MSSLLPTIILLATTLSPNVTYQIVTDEFYQHNTYAYHGTILVDGPDRAVYALDIEACETKERLVFHNIIDEMVFFNNRSPRKSFFSLQKDYDRCLLVIKKITHRNNMYYNRDYDYWYPNYNHIQIIPKRKIRKRSSRKAYKNNAARIVVYNNKTRSNIKPQSNPKVIIKPQKINYKQHINNVTSFHKNKKKRKKSHVKIKKRFKKINY